jgi:hypothetical protein
MSGKSKDNIKNIKNIKIIKAVKKNYHHLKPKERNPLGDMKTDENDMLRGYFIKNTSEMYSRNQLEHDREGAGYAAVFRNSEMSRK